MKDSPKSKKKQRKFKFKKKSQAQASSNVKKKVQANTPKEVSKGKILYNRSFVKNAILEKAAEVEEKVHISDSPEEKQSFVLKEWLKSFFAVLSLKDEELESQEIPVADKDENTTSQVEITEISITEQVSITEDNPESTSNSQQFDFSAIIQNFQKNYKLVENDLLLLLIPIILVVVLATVNLMNKQVERQLTVDKLTAFEYPVTVHPYPVLVSQLLPDISAQAAIVMDADSQVILYAKDPTVRFSMASTTKIMTSLVGLDYYQKNSLLTIKTPHVEGSNLGFYQGEKFTFEDLLYAMLLPSSNEAAYAVSENYPGGKDVFIQRMNQKAQQFHLVNTHYGDPAGLDDDQNFSTVVDMARLSSLAIQNPTFAQIVDTKQHVMTDVAGRQIYLASLNQLLGVNGINGIKTGTTEAAGEVLVTSTVQNGHTFIIVVMKSEQRFVDTLNLVNLISRGNVQYFDPNQELGIRK